MKKLFTILFCLLLCVVSYAQETVYMTLEKSGIYTVPCEVNGLKLRFVFDTGAADVSLSLVEAAFMLKNGYISEEDFVGTDTYALADGSLDDNMIVNLKRIKIGSKTLYNVKACISSKIEASLLLGQSAIRKLGKYSVDGNQLTIYPSASNYSSSSQQTTTYAQPTIFNGRTSKTYSNGTYEGNFKEGKRSGKGIMKYSNGNVYNGNWISDHYEGYGTYTWKDGAKYVGYFVDGYRHGKGTYTWANGDVYVGEWENNKRCGQGKMTLFDGGSYEGSWKDGEWNGYGTVHFKNGCKYVGYCVDGQLQGHGTYTFENGDVYVGDFAKNKREGEGKMTFVSGGSYEGGWKEGFCNGFGTLIYKNGDKYVGAFENNNRSGKGILYYKDGTIYDGQWSNDNFDGYGIFTWKDGEKYIGNFKGGYRDGYGTYTWSNGERFSGYWVKGKKNGQGTYYYANGSSKSGKWQDGKYVDETSNYGNSTYANNSYQTNTSSYSNSSSYDTNSYNSSSSDSYYSTPTYKYVPKSYYTAYTTGAINLREGRGTSYAVITNIPEGEWVFMETGERYKDFAKVLYVKTGEEGYVSTKYLDGFTPVKINSEGSLEKTGKTYSRYAEIKLENNTNVTTKITIGNNVYTLSPHQKQTAKYIESGTYNIMASSPGIIPYVGVDTVEGGYEYSWVFYIRTTTKY